MVAVSNVMCIPNDVSRHDGAHAWMTMPWVRRMDRCPHEDFKLVLKGKAPGKNLDVNGHAFPQSRRGILHVAGMVPALPAQRDLQRRI